MEGLSEFYGTLNLFYTPKRDDEHPHPFHMQSPPSPRAICFPLTTLRAEALRSSQISREEEGTSCFLFPDLCRKIEGSLLSGYLLSLPTLAFTGKTMVVIFLGFAFDYFQWQNIHICMNIACKVIECFHSRRQHLCKFIGTKEGVCIRKEFNSLRTGLGINMAAVLLFWDTNMAPVTSCENTQQQQQRLFRSTIYIR